MTRVINISQASGGGKEPDLTLVVANLGNTNLRLVEYDGERVRWERRIPTAEAAGAELPAGPIALVSVVPAVAEALIARWGAARVFTVRAATVPGLRTRYRPPDGMGADRVANAVGLIRHFGWGLAIDLGTATTFTVVSPEGEILGGAIMPGLGTARDSLAARTAQLPEVPLVLPEAPWGDHTVAAIQLGVVEGHVGAVTHLVARMRSALPAGAPVAVTGGHSHLLMPRLPEDYVHLPDLTIEGAYWAYRAAQAASSPDRS